MGQSLVKNYVHIVFSTKYRQPLIHSPVESELHAYLGGVCKKLDCPVIKVGGYTDHVHILCMLSKKIALMKLLEELKSHSSKWIKTKGTGYENFYWQDGYGAFSVNPAEIDRVTSYIANQHQHHSKKTFQDEYRGFLKKYKVEYDEKYVWDQIYEPFAHTLRGIIYQPYSQHHSPEGAKHISEAATPLVIIKDSGNNAPRYHKGQWQQRPSLS